MAQHKATLEKTLQSAFAHRKAGSKIAETVASTEAMVIAVNRTPRESEDADAIRRTRSAIAHRAYGKRIQDAWATLLGLIEDEGLATDPAAAEDTEMTGQHKASLRRILISACNSKKVGKQLADMAWLQDQVLEDLLGVYGAGGSNPDPVKEAALLAIKNA